MSSDEYEPNSIDAMLATIIANQKASDEKAREWREGFKEEFDEFKADCLKVNDRVGVLEKFKYKLMGAVAVATFFGGSIIDWLKGLK